MSKKLSDKDIKKILFDKYKMFEIPNDRLEHIYLDAIHYSVEYDKMKNFFCKKVEKYIVDEIKNDNVDMQIKVMEQYKSIITIARQKYNTMSIKEINNIYEQAIEYLKYIYNLDDTLSINIVNNFKYIISNNLIGKSINDIEVKLFNIKFMEEYIKYFNDTKRTISDLLSCTPEQFNKIIKGEENVSKDAIDTLCIEFSVNNYDELKEKIKELVKKKKLEIMVAKSKSKVKKEKQPIKTYDLKFMNLYLLKNNVSKETFSKFINIEISELDKVLDGSYKLPEDKLKRLYDLFNVKNYDELKIAVGKVIVAKNEKSKEELQNLNKKDIEKQSIKSEDVKRDLSIIKEYIKEFNYPKRNLINLLHCGEGVLEKILNGELLVKDSLLWELYSEFHVKDYDDFNNLLKNKIEKKKQSMAKESEESNSEFDITQYNINDVFNALNIDLKNELDKFIVIMLFGGINNRKYSEEDVSKILNVGKNYVIGVHKKALEELRKKLENSNNNKLIK